jgi:hypothetical protein
MLLFIFIVIIMIAIVTFWSLVLTQCILCVVAKGIMIWLKYYDDHPDDTHHKALIFTFAGLCLVFFEAAIRGILSRAAVCAQKYAALHCQNHHPLQSEHPIGPAS